MLSDINKAIAIQVNGSNRGKMPFIHNELRPDTVDRAREEIGLEREYKAIFLPEKLVNFIIE